MAERTGNKDRKTWANYERSGGTRPNSDTLTALHEMGVDINWLLSGDGTMLRMVAHPPDAADADSAYGLDDRLYEIAIKATMRWCVAADLDAPPEALAGMISRAVRMLRGREGVADKSESDLADEVDGILDIAREMLVTGVKAPKK